MFPFSFYLQAFLSKSLAPKEYAELENACVKACNNDLSPPKEKHMQTLLLACGGGQGNQPDRVSVSDINYVLNSISRIISKASGWISMLKSHIVLHRLFQECGGKFQREFFHLAESLRNTRSGGKEQDLFSLKYWKDDSSRTAFELSGWVRAYALYFEEYTCCAKFWPFLCSQGGGSTPMQSYEFDKLLQHVPVTQTLMRRLTDCEPVGEILQRNDSPVRAATALIFKDSLKVFKLANEGVCALVGSFFEQDKSKARKGLEIYKRSLVQHEDLQRLYTTCHNMQIVNKVPALEAPPETFLATMQEYVDTAKVGEMPAGVGARRTNKPSGDASSQSSLVATSSASTTPQQNANATLDALFGEMNIQTPPQNARDLTNTGVSAAGDFVAAGTTPSTSNDDPFGLANINNGNTRGQHQQAQPAASTSTTPSQLPPPIRAHQPPPQQQQEQQQQQQQQQIARRFLISSYDVTGVSNDLIALAKSVMTIKPNYSYTASEVQEQVTLINQLGVFKKIEPLVTETRDGMVIDFQLESHPEIRSIVVSGCDYLPNTVLTSAFKGQMNKVLNMHKFHSGMRKIRDWYNVNAIPSNILGADVDTDTGVVELRISEPKIGNVNVRFMDAAGNPQKKGTTKPSIIARYLSNVKPGKVYSVKGVQDDLRAVYANCPVEDVSSQPIPRNAAAGGQQQQQNAEGENLLSRDTTAKVQDSMVMDFTVNIVEKSPGGFSAGGGMSAKGLTEGNFGGLLANVNYVQRNLFGKCQKLNLGLDVVPKSNSKKGIDADIKLSLSDPWIEGDKRRTARTFNLNTAAVSASQIYGASQFQDENDEGAEDRLSSALSIDANSTKGDFININTKNGDIGSTNINNSKVGEIDESKTVTSSSSNSEGEKTGGFSKSLAKLGGGKSRDDVVAKEDSTSNNENSAVPSNNKSSNEVRVRKLISSIDYSRPLANGWNGTFIASWCRSSLWDGQRNSILHDAYGAPLTFSGSGCDVAATSQLRVVYSAPDGDTQLMLSAEQAVPLRPDWLNFTRLFARAQRTFQFPIFSSSKSREQNLSAMTNADRETGKIKRGVFATTPIKLTFASKGGNVIGDLPPHEAFPIGGTNSVRGYNEGAVGTARKFVVGSAELVVPTGIEHVSASLFFDCGSDLNSGSSILGDPAGTRGKPGSGFGYGAGFQLASPFGPLRLEYAKNNHGITRAHFGIGRSF